MQVKAETIINWIDQNLPPLSWRIIVMKQMKLLLKYKISPTKIDGNTYFNAEIIDALRQLIKNEYDKDMPSF